MNITSAFQLLILLILAATAIVGCNGDGETATTATTAAQTTTTGDDVDGDGAGAHALADEAALATASLEAVDGSGVSGQAVLTQTDDTVDVVATVTGDAEGASLLLSGSRCGEEPVTGTGAGTIETGALTSNVPGDVTKIQTVIALRNGTTLACGTVTTQNAAEGEGIIELGGDGEIVELSSEDGEVVTIG